MTHIIITLILVKLKICILPIYGIIGEVCEEIFEILATGLFICLCGKSSQPFFKDVDSQRVHPIEQHIDSEIKFESIDQIRLF